MSRLDKLRNKRDKLSLKLRECERQIEEEQRKVSRQKGSESFASFNSADTLISMPMPGKIIKVFVKEGDIVKKSDQLFLLEALKMENEMLAPKSGRVIKVNIQVGDIVESGSIAIVLQ